MRRRAVAAVFVLGLCAAGIATPAASEAITRTTLRPGHWTGTGPASTTTHRWTFTVSHAGLVLMRSTGAGAPVALTNSSGTTTLMHLAVEPSDSDFTGGTFATATRRLAAGDYALTGRPQKNESIRVDLIPDSVAVLSSSLARDDNGRTRVIGDVINGTTVTRSGVKLHVTFRNARGASLGRVTVSPLLNRIPQGGTDPVAALVTPPSGTANIVVTTASSGTQSHAVPGGLRVTADITIDCTAPPNSGFCEAETVHEAGVLNTSSSARRGLVVAVVDRDYDGQVSEVDVAPVAELAAGANIGWGGFTFSSEGEVAAPWLPIDVQGVGPYAHDPAHLAGGLTAYAQASS